MIDGYNATHKVKEARHMLQYEVNLSRVSSASQSVDTSSMHILKSKFLVYVKRITSHWTHDRQQAYQKRQYTWHRRRTYTDFILKHCKYENTDISSAAGTSVPLNFNAPDDTAACWTVTNRK
jgi:beta-galactosidase beta subunit